MAIPVQEMFSGIAQRYDLANDVLSLGVHRLWRRSAVRFAGIGSGMRVLDLCTGTGDLAFCLADVVGSSGRVVGIDFVPEMIDLARQKQARSNSRQISRGDIEFRVGDALSLPFTSQSFDAVTVSFGIRNVVSPESCLLEIERVLVPGGIALVVEFGKPKLPVFSNLYTVYARHVMPRIGEMVTGDRSAYEYLPRTSLSFPDDECFQELMASAGLLRLRRRRFMSGIAYAYVGHRASEPITAKQE